MVRKTCEQCGNEAAVTVCWLLSTLGSSPRAQKCSKVSFFCLGCIQRVCAPDGTGMPLLLRQRLQEAYTATTSRFKSDSASDAGTVKGEEAQ